MRPFGMKIRKSGIHSSDKCKICRAYPPTKGSARMRIKENTFDDEDTSNYRKRNGLD